MMNRILLGVVGCMWLAGCSSNPVVYKDKNSVTLEHAKGDFRKTMELATELCADHKKAVKHDSTDCPDKCISTFSCVAK